MNVLFNLFTYKIYKHNVVNIADLQMSKIVNVIYTFSKRCKFTMQSLITYKHNSFAFFK